MRFAFLGDLLSGPIDQLTSDVPNLLQHRTLNIPPLAFPAVAGAFNPRTLQRVVDTLSHGLLEYPWHLVTAAPNPFGQELENIAPLISAVPTYPNPEEVESYARLVGEFLDGLEADLATFHDLHGNSLTEPIKAVRAQLERLTAWTPEQAQIAATWTVTLAGEAASVASIAGEIQAHVDHVRRAHQDQLEPVDGGTVESPIGESYGEVLRLSVMLPFDSVPEPSLSHIGEGLELLQIRIGTLTGNIHRPLIDELERLRRKLPARAVDFKRNKLGEQLRMALGNVEQQLAAAVTLRTNRFMLNQEIGRLRQDVDLVESYQPPAEPPIARTVSVPIFGTVEQVKQVVRQLDRVQTTLEARQIEIAERLGWEVNRSGDQTVIRQPRREKTAKA